MCRSWTTSRTVRVETDIQRSRPTSREKQRKGGHAMFIKCTVQEGFIESERLVNVQTCEGLVEQVPVHHSFVRDDAVLLPWVLQEAGRILVEFPNESARGRWRAWVPRDSVRVDLADQVPA